MGEDGHSGIKFLSINPLYSTDAKADPLPEISDLQCPCYKLPIEDLSVWEQGSELEQWASQVILQRSLSQSKSPVSGLVLQNSWPGFHDLLKVVHLLNRSQVLESPGMYHQYYCLSNIRLYFHVFLWTVPWYMYCGQGNNLTIFLE